MKNSGVKYYPSGKHFIAETFGTELGMMIEQVRLETQKENILFLCIGSDRSTGDSLGPLVGYRLEKDKALKINVIGSLVSPVHAVNLSNILIQMREKYANDIIVAIDASIGKKEHIGQITLSRGAIRPGLGVNKELESVGDIAVTGIVACAGRMETFLLQNIRLSLVMNLADCIVDGIHYFELFYEKRKKKQKSFL